MAVKFPKEIKTTQVGYQLTAKGLGKTYDLSVLRFEEFIAPYSCHCQNIEAVLGALEQHLSGIKSQQDSIVDSKRPVYIDVLARATLEREATKNAIDLLKTHYSF